MSNSNGISVPNGGFVLVADHGKALLLKNTGTPVEPLLEVKSVFEARENPPTHDQGTDRPGTVFSGSHHSSIEQTDWHAIAGQRFLGDVAEAVGKAQANEVFDAIALVAPPKALAELRNAISPGVRASVIGELDKDLTGMPVTEIARHLAA